MRTNRSLLAILIASLMFTSSATAKERGVQGASRVQKDLEEPRRERQKRLQQLEEAVEEFDDQAKRRWEKFSEEAEDIYERLFKEAMEVISKKASGRLRRLNDLSRTNVEKKLPKVAANVHKDISPKVHERVRALFDQFVAAEMKLVAEFQRHLKDQFPELIQRIDREVRAEERKEVARQQDSMLHAWAAFCRAEMLSSLPQPGESYNAYFARVNSRYWDIMRVCTEQYIARLAVSNELYRTRLTAFNQSYWAYMERCRARYSAYISLSTQLYFNRMACSTQLYANYIANSTQRYAAYIRMSNQNYLNYLRASNQMYWDYIRYWNVVYYKRLGLI